MDRPGTIIYNADLREFKNQLEKDTGFVCYEVTPGDQTTFYGTSDMFEDFKTAIGNMFNTGTIAFCMDTGDRYMYHKMTDIWYKLN